MQYVRVYAGLDGESHFDEVQVALPLVAFVPGKPPIGFATAVPVTTLNFVSIPTDWEGEYHPTPRRQFWITLAGEVAVPRWDHSRCLSGSSRPLSGWSCPRDRKPPMSRSDAAWSQL